MKCAWCKTKEAIDTFWIREVGEFRDSKTALCVDCRDQFRRDGNQAVPDDEVAYQGKTYKIKPCRRCEKVYEERREVADGTSKFSGMTEMVWVCQCFTLNSMELQS
jgi:hypothetical protein